MSVNSRLRLRVKGKHSIGREFHPESSCARKETADIDILVTSTNGDRKIVQSIRITSRPPFGMRKWNQFSKFRSTSTKVIPIEKTYTGYISIMSQGFKRGS